MAKDCRRRGDLRKPKRLELPFFRGSTSERIAQMSVHLGISPLDLIATPEHVLELMYDELEKIHKQRRERSRRG